MSINITVGANGATTGRTDQSIPGDGDIDTREEAEAALTLLPEGSTDTVMVGEREYTRAQLIELRDGSDSAPESEPETAPESTETPETETPPASTRTVPGEGVSHGISLDGYGAAGFDTYGHSGGGGRLTYTAGIPLVSGDHRVFADISVGGDVGSMSMGFLTPGGENASSGFTRYGARLGLGLRYTPPVLDHRFWLGLGASVGVSGLSTAASTLVSTPGECVPDDFGRPDCEPMAGPRMGNAGTTGLVNPRTGGARGTSGAIITEDITLTLGVDVLQESWGSLGLYGYVGALFTQALPSDGDGISYAGLLGGGGLMVRVGGSASQVPASDDTDADGVADADDRCAETPADTEVDAHGCPAALTLSPVAGSEVIGSGEGLQILPPAGREWPEGLTVAVDGEEHPEVTVPAGTRNPIVVPYSLLPEGTPHTIELRRPDGSVYATIGPVNTQRATTERGSLPAGITFEIAPENPEGNVGEPIDIATFRNDGERPVRFLLTYADGTMQRVDVPASTADGPGRATVTVPADRTRTSGSFPLVISHPGSRYLRPVTYEVHPRQILTSAAVVIPTSRRTHRPTYYATDAMRITVSTREAREHTVRVRVGTGTPPHTAMITIPAGDLTGGSRSVEISLPGSPGTWTDLGVTLSRTPVDVPVWVAPVSGERVGTEVSAGTAPIRRPAGGGGGGGGHIVVPGV